MFVATNICRDIMILVAASASNTRQSKLRKWVVFYLYVPDLLAVETGPGRAMPSDHRPTARWSVLCGGGSAIRLCPWPRVPYHWQDTRATVIAGTGSPRSVPGPMLPSAIESPPSPLSGCTVAAGPPPGRCGPAWGL